MEPSDSDEAFASIVARLGDLGHRSSRRLVIGAGVGVGTAAALILFLALRWQWQAIVVFVLTFVVALVAGLSAMMRVVHRRRR